MSKNRKSEALSPSSLSELQQHKRELGVIEMQLIEKALRSNNPSAIIEAQDYIKKGKANQNVPMSFTFAPEHEFYSGQGYKQKWNAISYDLLRGMASTPQIVGVVQTRIDQALNYSNFTTDLNRPGWTIRKRLGRFADDKERELSDIEKKEIDGIVDWVENGGTDVDEWDREDLSDFFKKIYKDSWEIDQAAFEVSWTRRGLPYQYIAVDGGTVRLAETFDDREEYMGQSKENGYLPKYVQVWKNQIYNQYYPWQMCVGMRNVASNVKNNGYSVSELETLIQIVTWMLFGMQYNGNFFQQGSNPKGLLNFKNIVDPTQLEAFKQSWRNTMTGVGNCLSENTFIYTDKGGLYISELFDEDNSDKSVNIWTGTSFEKAKVYKTGLKKLTRMFINNGTKIECSPDHRFMIIGENGFPEWKRREEIRVGDFVLTNKISVESISNIYYNGKKIERDLFEVLGWLTGDGYIGKDIPKQRRCGLFYHHNKEVDICERHLSILEKYGINSYIKKHYLKDPEKTRKKYGFKSINDYHLRLYIIDSTFHRFLMELGFYPSHDGKIIPAFMFSEESLNKCSFLKGFFSADGNNSTGKAIQMTIVDDILREQTKLLLLSEGINCGNHEGKKRVHTFGVSYDGYRLLIKDIDTFFKKIGFIQPHKQLRIKSEKCLYMKESISPYTSKFLSSIILKKDDELKVLKRARRNLTDLLKGGRNVSRQLIDDYILELGIDVPDFYSNYNFEKVIKLEDTEIDVPMYDIEVFDNSHQFIANGIVTHNSHKMGITSGAEVEWVSFQQTNKDMEFHQWNEFLTVIACVVFRIDPDEVGFHLLGQKGMFGQDGQKERLKHSKEKGLEPFLRYWENQLDQYWIKPLTKGKYEFKFTGINIEDEQVVLDRDIKILQNGGMSAQDFFLKYSARELDQKKDIILNAIYLQYKNAQQYGSPESNAAVDQMNGDSSGNPFDEFEQMRKSEGDPFYKAFDYYLKNGFKQE